MSKHYSKDIATAITGFLTRDEWKYSFDQDIGIIDFGLSLDGDINHIDYRINIYSDGYSVIVVSSVGVRNDTKLRSTMANFICHANYGLRKGGFQYDMRDGEISYHIFADCYDALPSETTIKRDIYLSANMMEKYAPGICGILFKDMSVKDAIKKCEGNDDETDPEEIISMLREILDIGEDENITEEELADRIADYLGLSEKDKPTEGSEGNDDINNMSADELIEKIAEHQEKAKSSKKDDPQIIIKTNPFS